MRLQSRAFLFAKMAHLRAPKKLSTMRICGHWNRVRISSPLLKEKDRVCDPFLYTPTDLSYYDNSLQGHVLKLIFLISSMVNNICHLD